MLLEALLPQDLKPFRKAQTWLINTVRKILFKLKSISGFLVFLVLFNLQSAFRSRSSSRFFSPLSRVPLHNIKSLSVCQHFFSLFLRVFSSSPICIRHSRFPGRSLSFSLHSVEKQLRLGPLLPRRGEKSRKLSLAACVGVNLSSRAVASQVLSAPVSLTTVFEMGTGGPSP